MKKLLKHQVRKHFGNNLIEDPKIKGFIEEVNRTYGEFDEQINFIIHATELSNQEFTDLHQKLKKEIQQQEEVLTELNEVIIVLNEFRVGAQYLELDEFQDLGGSQLVHIIKEQAGKIKLAEQEQIALLENIKKRNVDLEDFAQIVSHDLKTPLGNISTIVHWIQEDYNQYMDETISEHFNMILKNLERMDKLISGVLEFSRLNAFELDNEKVNLNDLIDEIVDYMELPENIKIRVLRRLPVINANKIKIQQLYTNLISNAIKAASHKPEGIVEIDVEIEKELKIFTIKDNGKGINPIYFDKIFQLFQSLEKQKGTGVGLYIVKKVVESYGGTITLDSKLGDGTVFKFTLDNCIN